MVRMYLFRRKLIRSTQKHQGSAISLSSLSFLAQNPVEPVTIEDASG